jgi:O-antigen/teichoic acid export membrane protein
MSLATKVFRSSTLNLVEHFVQLAVVFFVTPLMIRHLGELQYGIWLVSMAIVGYYKLLDLGITTAGTRFLARSIGAENREDYQINLSTLLSIYRRIGLFTIPLSIVVAFTAPHFIKSNDYTHSIRWILLAFGFNITIRFFTRIFPVILRSHVRYDLIVISSLTRTLIQGGLIIYFLLHGAGLTALIAIHISADIIDQLLLYVFSRKIAFHAKITTKNYQSARAREIFKYGSTAFFASIGTNLRLGFDPIIIGTINGLAFVPIYSIGNRFLQSFIDIVNAVFGGHLVAALSQTEASRGDSGVRDNFLKMIRLSSAFAMLGGCALAIYGPPLIARWIGPDFKDSGTVLLILITPYVLVLAQYPVWGLFYSINRHRYIVYIGIFGGLLNLILSVFLAYKIGFFGVVWGTFIDLTIVSIFIIPTLIFRSIELSATSYLTTIIPGFLKASIPSLIWYFVIRHLLEPDYARLFILAAGHAIIVFGFLWFTTLTKHERKLIVTMFRSTK